MKVLKVCVCIILPMLFHVGNVVASDVKRIGARETGFTEYEAKSGAYYQMTEELLSTLLGDQVSTSVAAKELLKELEVDGVDVFSRKYFKDVSENCKSLDDERFRCTVKATAKLYVVRPKLEQWINRVGAVKKSIVVRYKSDSKNKQEVNIASALVSSLSKYGIQVTLLPYASGWKDSFLGTESNQCQHYRSQLKKYKS